MPDRPAEWRRGPLGPLRDLPIEDVRQVVATHLAHLPQQERMVIARRLGLNANQKPLSYTAIAREMGLSLEKVRVIEMRALRRLRWLHDQSLAQGGDANGPGREG